MMKRWQVIILFLFLGVAAGLVVQFPSSRASLSRVVVPTSLSLAPPTVIPTVTPSPSEPVTLLFTGDVMLSRSVGELMATKRDWVWPFARIASTTAAADLTFGNLETTISTHGTKGGCTYCFHADPRVVQGLVRAGFDVMSVANNHVWDYGPQAFTDTILSLSTSDISYVGGGRDSAEARSGVIREVRGTKIGYLAYTDLLPSSTQAGPHRAGVNLFDAGRMAEDIAALRAKVDIVVVSFHTGDEYQLAHNEKQQRIYRAAIDAGADLVIGHHPHVVQEVEQYGKGWIAYSLGNFVFDQNFSTDTVKGLMLSVRVVNGKVAQVDRIPIAISNQYQPSLVR